jgi:hypothetical protein
MDTALKAKLKAETIAQAVYTATGIQPDVIYRDNRNPLITFNKQNGRRMKDFILTQIKKKSDVDIDILPIVQPVIFGNLLPYLIAAAAGIFIAGYLSGQAH